MRAGRIPHSEELLKVSKRDPRFGRHLGRTEIRIGETVLDDAADSLEQRKIKMRVAALFLSPRAAKSLSAPARDVRHDAHALRRQGDLNKYVVRARAGAAARHSNEAGRAASFKRCLGSPHRCSFFGRAKLRRTRRHG
jgi:hypothetical protein